MNIGNKVRLGAFALAVAGFAQPAAAVDDPVAGRTLFNGNAVTPCTQCHVNVDNRRQAIDPTGDLDFDAVLAAFLNAIATVPGMNPFNAGLNAQQKRDIAAYIADVPKARPNLVDFVASATNTETAATTITFSNGVTSTASLTLTSIGITGASASDFLIKTTGTTCSNSMTLASSQQCFINVTFRSATGTPKTALLNVTFTPQGGVSTTRTAQLSGTVSGQGGGSSANTGGGGALPLVGLGLLIAAGALRRRPIKP